MTGTEDAVIDSHIHLFLTTPIVHPEKWSGGLTAEQASRMKQRFEQNLKERGQPPVDATLSTPEEYARRWIEEFDLHGIDAGVFLSFTEDPEPMHRFVSACPDRFTGYAFVNPLDTEAPVKLERQVRDFGFRGLKLIATNQHFTAHDRNIYPLWEKACELGIPVLIHYGMSIGYNADYRYASPLDLQPVLRDFPGLTFILAHFGAGFFREALMLCYQADNILLDSSSSNIWIRYQGCPLTLREVFRLSLEAVGPGRVIFGTDSSYFPRGFRRDILDEQRKILVDLGLDASERGMVLGDNIRRLAGIGPSSAQPACESPP